MAAPTFEPPGPGTWELDRSHYESGMTPLLAEVIPEGVVVAYRKRFAEIGVPADSTEFRVVNGFVYTRVRPLFGADKEITRQPPDWLVKLLGRVHPEMRRREKLAAAELAGDRFSTAVREWNEQTKVHLLARNLELQSVDLTQLDDLALASHIEVLIAHVAENNIRHHSLHVDDLGPLGQFVVQCRDWGIDVEESVQALIGASPSTNEPRRRLAAIRSAVDEAGITPTSLDDVRAVSEDVAGELDSYLDRHGSVLYTGYDLDGPTLGERPRVVLTAVMSATGPDEDDRGDRAAARLRENVPTHEIPEFERLLTNARLAMDMRDDNGPLTIEWPTGLLRLGLLEGGRRLAERGRIAAADHIFELDRSEISPLIATETGPSSDTLSTRANERNALRSLDPPAYLGPPPEDPPIHLLPPAMGRAMDMVITVIAALFGTTDGEQAPLSGTGIGDDSYVGIARVAETAEEAIATMEDGDILITRATSPAFNLVLAIAGGLVTVHGGPMCHAAVLSRELKLPAVIGVEDCLEHIKNGDRVEIDACNGTVKVLA